MADDRKITITILENPESTGSESDASSSEKLGVEEQFNAAVKKMKSSVKEDEKKRAAKIMLLNQTFQSAKDNFLKTLTFSLRRANTLTEDYIGEMQLQHITTLIRKGVGFATTVASGAMLGAKVGGGYGAVAGAVVSAASWGYNEYVSGLETKSGIYQNLNANIFQTEFLASRAGLINNSRGTEN